MPFRFVQDHEVFYSHAFHYLLCSWDEYELFSFRIIVVTAVDSSHSEQVLANVCWIIIILKKALVLRDDRCLLCLVGRITVSWC